MKRVLTGFAAALGLLLSVPGAAKAEEKTDLMPKIHGVFRGRYEMRWDDFGQRFQVRNARVSLEGNILRNLDYYFRVDLCDRGSMKFLDGWARWRVTQRWALKAGRFRVPFGVDCFRGPGTYIFANRSFAGKYMANVRQVGLQGGYYGQSVPLTVEAGVFNSSGSSDQEVWQKGMDYAAKLTWHPGAVSLSASILSMNPWGVRMNIADGAVTWASGRLLLSGEFQNLHYCDASFSDTQAWLAWACYTFDIRLHPFNAVNIHGRYDYMGNYSTGKPESPAESRPAVLPVSEPERHRITVGSTLGCTLPRGVKAEVMLDYEHYFYAAGAPAAADNRLCAELIVKF